MQECFFIPAPLTEAEAPARDQYVQMAKHMAANGSNRLLLLVALTGHKQFWHTTNTCMHDNLHVHWRIQGGGQPGQIQV